MRIREIDNIGNINIPWTNTTKRCDSVMVYTNGTNAGVDTGYYKITTDVVTPNFLSRHKRGEIINNPFSSIEFTATESLSGTYHGVWVPTCTGTSTKEFWVTGSSCIATLPSISKSNFSSLFNVPVAAERSTAHALAATQAFSNIVPADVQGLVFMAELRKTLVMMGTPLKNLERLIRQLRRKFYRMSRAKRLALYGDSFFRFLSSEWLRYRYGFMPLLYDLDGYFNALARDRSSQRYTARGSSSWTYKPADTTISGVTTGCSTKATQVLKKTHSGHTRAGVLYEHSLTMSESYGFSLSDLPSAAWELIPFSFVADWFINIGEYIRAVTPKAGVKVLCSWVSEVEEANHEYTNTYYGGTYGNLLTDDSRVHKRVYTGKRKSRVPYAHPELATKTALFDLNLSRDRKHVIDSLALINQLIRK